VIHTEDSIELALHCAVKNGVWREWALEVAVALKLRNGRGDDFDFLEAEIAILTGVRI
jgi:hypothetical protein